MVLSSSHLVHLAELPSRMLLEDYSYVIAVASRYASTDPEELRCVMLPTGFARISARIHVC